MNRWIKYFLMVFLLIWTGTVSAQNYLLEYQNLEDSTLWFIRNNTSNPIKPTSFTLNWYHMKPYFIAWNNDPTQPFYNNTNRETNQGFKYTWKYKTTYGCSVGDTLRPGERLQVAMTVNYDENNSDTVMPANVTMFVNTSNGFDELEVVPVGSSCSFRRIYLNSYAKNQGISYFSTVWTPITSGNCVDGLGMLMVPFNGFNLKPTPSSVMPNCANGRLWTAYGHAKDSQLYYDGYESDTTYWRQVIRGLDPGDYLAFASHVTVSKNFILAMKSDFESLGLDVDGLLSKWSSSSAQMLMMGRKGVPKGKAGLVFSEMKANASARSVVGNFVMIKDQALDEMKPYPQCYESLSVIHKPYVPDTSHVGLERYSIEVAIVPNPVEDVGFVSSNIKISGYQILNGLGVALETVQHGEGINRFSISMTGKPPGLYYVILYAEGNKRYTVKKLIKS